MVDNISDNDNALQNEGEELVQNDSEDNELFNEVSDGGWISWFCNLEGNEFFVEIDENYILQNKSAFGFQKNYKKYNQLLEIILSPDPPSDINLQSEEYIENMQLCREIFGLFHSKFITTPNGFNSFNSGLALVREKFLNGIYGNCPRILCNKQIVLPAGLSYDIKYSRVKVFCPNCEELYKPRQKCSEIDGAFFGQSFPQLFLMTYPELKSTFIYKKYIPKLYGFKIFKKRGSKYYVPPEKRDTK